MVCGVVCGGLWCFVVVCGGFWCLVPPVVYTTLPHNSIKEKLINLIEWTFKREGSLYIA